MQGMQSVLFFSFSFASSLTHSSVHTKNANAYNLTCAIDIRSLEITISSFMRVKLLRAEVWFIMLALVARYNPPGQS